MTSVLELDSLAGQDAGLRDWVQGAVPLEALLRLPGNPNPYLLTGRPGVKVQGVRGQRVIRVDKLLGHEEVVLKPLPWALEPLIGVQGTALLGTGQPIFILDVPRLADQPLGHLSGSFKAVQPTRGGRA